MRSVITVLLTTACFAGPPVAAQRALEAEQTASDLAKYHLLVTAYRAGDDGAVRGLATFDRERLRRVLGAVDGPLDTTRPWDAGRFAAAAMLHTDAAFISTQPADAPRAFESLDAASRLLEEGGAGLREFTARWYVAVTRIMRDRNWLPEAEHLLELGRRRLPGNASIACESGTLAEFFASDPRLGPTALRTLNDTVNVGRGQAREVFADVARRRAARLRQAADWLGASVDAEPTNSSCRVHLGRVLSLLDDERTGEVLSDPRSSADLADAYLAALFLAASAERGNRLDAAEAHYRRAIAALPQAHAAYLGLSALLERSGRPAEARAMVREAAGEAMDSRREPWWWYFFEPPGVPSSRLDALRREVRR